MHSSLRSISQLSVAAAPLCVGSGCVPSRQGEGPGNMQCSPAHPTEGLKGRGSLLPLPVLPLGVTQDKLLTLLSLGRVHYSTGRLSILKGGSQLPNSLPLSFPVYSPWRKRKDRSESRTRPWAEH